MKDNERNLPGISEDVVMRMMDDTSQLVARHNVEQLSASAVAAQSSNTLTNNVEFWKWMSRNYQTSGIFDSASSMQEYIRQGIGKEQWFAKQLQGKGYEWDWMARQRGNAKNILKTYDAGDVVNRAASDVTQRNMLSGKSQEFQMKAYTSKTNPNLKNTPKDMTVVTNSEKVGVVKNNGYQNVEEFQDAQLIQKRTNDRLEQVKQGKASPAYNFKNVAGTMAKAGLIGCAIGIGSEAIGSYRAWKSGQLTDKEYLAEVLKAGGDAGVTAGVTSGVMIPVSAAIATAGASTLLTIPVAFVIGGAVNALVAPCFGRGKYKQILTQAKYYQNLEEVYMDLARSMEHASEQYYSFVAGMQKQSQNHYLMQEKSMEMNSELKELYDSI